MTDVGTGTSRRILRDVATALIAVPAACVLIWLSILAAFYVPPLGLVLLVVLPTAVIIGAIRLTAKRWRWFAVSFAISGVLTLVFMVWLLWSFGAGMEDFD